MGAIADFFLASPAPQWYANTVNYTAFDANGQQFGLNSQVKLLGTVTAINAQDPHFGEVTITCKPVTVNQTQGNQVTSIQVPPASLTLGS